MTMPAGLEHYGWPPPPRVNWNLIGHEDAERELLDAFNSQKMHHAWLLTGPRGIGKATLAFRFARFVLAQGSGAGGATTGGLFADAPREAPESLYVDPQDPLFRRVASAGHADLVTLERSLDEKKKKLRSEIVVPDVREIGGFMARTPAEGGWRVVVVDCADEMNRHAANALLKVLEEPPSRALLLLVSHTPGQLLPTIRSRCRTLGLRPLGDETVASLTTQYRSDITTEEAADLARLAGGSIGRALGLAEQGGLTLYANVMGLLAGLPTIDGVALHRMGDTVAKAGADETFNTVVGLIRELLSRLIRHAAVNDRTAAPVGTSSPEEQALFARLAPAASLDRWLQVWEKTSRLLARADSARLDRKQVLLNVFLEFESAVRR
jgi:DNA polymerase-3 subunit delta'